jgi:hypothetical protein
MHHDLRRIDIVIVLALVLVAGAGPRTPLETAATTAHRDRLREMPREQRLMLREKLREFDALPAAEQAAVRSLDARIAELSPAERANYWSVLRRYHHWVQGLTEAQRGELDAAPPGERMRIVTRLRAQERTGGDAEATPLFLQVLDVPPSFPYELAHRLKVWFELTPEKRSEVEAIGSAADQQKRLAELGQGVKFRVNGRLLKADEDTLLERMEANPQLKSWLAAIPQKKADPTKNEKARRRIATNYHLLENPPKAVDPARLMRFDAALPGWSRAQFDPLPPEEARRRLTIVYRLLFPPPAEMPEPATPTPTPGPAPR